MRRRWRHATALPADLVEAFSKACRHCEMLWRGARPESDYAAVLPALEEVLRLVRQVAQAKAEALGVTPYAALLDEFEPGGSVERIEAIFDDLAGFLPGFLDEVLARQAAAPAPLPLGGPFPRAQQEALGRRMMAGGRLRLRPRPPRRSLASLLRRRARRRAHHHALRRGDFIPA